MGQALLNNEIRDDGTIDPILNAKLLKRALGEIYSGKNLGLNVRSFTSSTTLDPSDSHALCDSSGGTFTLTLPPCNTWSSRDVKKTPILILQLAAGTAPVTIAATSGDTINGSTTIKLNQYQTWQLVSNGSNKWYAFVPIITTMFISVKDPQFGAKGDGSTDDTASLAAAIAYMGNVIGGVLWFPSGTYNYNSGITMPTNTIFKGVGRGISILAWTGGNSACMVKIPNASTACGIEDITLDTGSATIMTGLWLQDTRYNTITRVNITSTTTASGIGIFMEAGNGGYAGTYNCVWNSLYDVLVTKFNVGLQFLGVTNGVTPAVVTVNKFYDLRILGSIIGIRQTQWCDSNSFYNCHIQLENNNSYGVIFNDSATPATDVGVYNNNFYDLAIDAFGGLAACTGLLFNAAKQIQIYGFLHSPTTFPGLLVNDNFGRAISYWIANNQISAANNSIEFLSKGIYRGSLQASDNSGHTYVAAVADLTFNTETYDIDSCFSSPTYTAPHTNFYNVSLMLTHNATVTGGDTWLLKLLTTKRTYSFVYYVPAAVLASFCWSIASVDMNATDTLKFTIERSTGAGTFTLYNDKDFNKLTIEAASQT